MISILKFSKGNNSAKNEGGVTVAFIKNIPLISSNTDIDQTS